MFLTNFEDTQENNFLVASGVEMEKVDKIVIFSLQNVTFFFFCFQLLRFSFCLQFLNFYNFTTICLERVYFTHSLLLREPFQSGNSHSYGPSVFSIFSFCES